LKHLHLSLTKRISWIKVLTTSLLLCFCLTTQSVAANRNNDIRSMPFIEMMVTMMKIMNSIMGGSNNYFSGINSLPYSPAFMPGMGNGLGSFSNLPMSPAGFNALPLNNTTPTYNKWQNSFQPGQDAYQVTQAKQNFWDPDSQEQTPVSVNKVGLNGIWQSLSGDVIAIYNNNHFLWSDGNARNISGKMVVRGNQMIAYIPAKNMTLRFDFYIEPGQFIVKDSSSRIYTFKRIH